MKGRRWIPRALGLGALLAGALATGAPLSAQLAIQGAGVATMAEHRVDAGNGVEQASGTLFGGEGRLFVGSRLEIFVHAAAGRLNADSASADDRDLAEGEVRASVLTVPWLALHAGVSTRSYTTALVRQRWTALRFGGEARLPFVGGGVIGTVRAEVMPSVSVSGLEKPNRAFAAGAGLDYRIGAFALGLRYELERYDFPATAGFGRREQISALTAHAGVTLGRRVAQP